MVIVGGRFSRRSLTVDSSVGWEEMIRGRTSMACQYSLVVSLVLVRLALKDE